MSDQLQSQSQDGADKRRFPRTERHLAVQYQVSHDGAWVQGAGSMEALDISGGGLRIRMSDAVTPESSLYLHVPLEDGPVYAMARVAWAHRTEEGDYLAGIEFIDLPSEEQARLERAEPL